MPELAPDKKKYEVCFDFKPSPPSEDTMTQLIAATGLPYVSMNRIYYGITAPASLSTADIERLLRNAVSRFEEAKERFQNIEIIPIR